LNHNLKPEIKTERRRDGLMSKGKPETCLSTIALAKEENKKQETRNKKPETSNLKL